MNIVTDTKDFSISFSFYPNDPERIVYLPLENPEYILFGDGGVATDYYIDSLKIKTEGDFPFDKKQK